MVLGRPHAVTAALTAGLLAGSVLVAAPATAAVGGGGDAGSDAGAIAAPAPKATMQQTAVPTTTAPSASREPAGDHAEGDGHDHAEGPVVAELDKTRVKSFGLVGVTWAPDDSVKGVEVEVRTRSKGTWSAWRHLHQDPDGQGVGRPATEAEWVGDADGVAARVTAAQGTPKDVKIATIDGGDDPTPTTGTSGDTTASPAGLPAGSASTDASPAGFVQTASSDGSPTFTPRPAIITRSKWGAISGGKCDSPTYGSTTMGVVVHHTVGSNSYSKSQSASIVRATQKYHVNGRGWCDIGYNFLVDKYGQIFEGRKGGIDRNVRAAHSGNNAVNTYTTGISMMGTFSKIEPSAAQKTAMVKLVGWRLATTLRPATGTYSLGGKKLNRIAGHRDVIGTECPGAAAYRWLSETKAKNGEDGLRVRVASYIKNYSTPISREAKRLGSSVVGSVTFGEQGATGGGRASTFTKANLSQRPGSTRAYAVRSPLLTAYKSSGLQSGSWGYPIASATSTSSTTTQKFTKGTATWRKSTGKVTFVKGSTSTPSPSPTPSSTASSSTKNTPSKATVGSSRTLTVTGRGYGHGIGMSQYGAQGAAKAGVLATAILAKYYPGTTKAKRTGSIRVLITKDTTAPVTVLPAKGLRFRNVSGGTKTLPTKTSSGRTIEQWRIGPDPKAKSRQVVEQRVAGKWSRFDSAVRTTDLQFEASAPLRLVLPGGSTVTYRGALRAAYPKKGSTDRNTVNVLSIDDYVRGVLSAEMPSSWHKEALKAQAVAARTYGARAITSSRYYDICDTTSCQVYRGVSAETAATDAAVASTKGTILTYGGKPAFTQFSSSSGGRTAKGSQAYLKEQADSWDDWSGNANNLWVTKVKVSGLEKKYPSLGSLRTIEVTKRTGTGSWNGRAQSVRLVGSKKTITVTGDDVRWGLGLKSNWFAFR
ncbi:MAG: SpoIID/LytB domain-containing protein [Aeromicrobium erythreum]